MGYWELNYYFAFPIQTNYLSKLRFMQVPKLNETLKNIWNYPPNEALQVSQQIDSTLQQKMLSIFSLGDYYSYVFNLSSMQFTRLSCGMERMLGWSSEEFTPLFALEHIHPDDRNWFLNAENAAVKFFSQLVPEQFFNYKVRYDYRMQKKCGNYARILHQVVVVNYSTDGAILDTFGLHTDISHLKSSNSRNLSFIGLNGTESIIDYPVEAMSGMVEKHFFSKRERQILCHLWEGRETKDIANLLFVSNDTVDTHRRNMLKKAEVTNTVALIRFALSIGEL